MRSAISELIARPNARGWVGYVRTYVKIWLRGLRLDRPPGWGGHLLSPKSIRTYVRTYTSVRTRARAYVHGERAPYLSLSPGWERTHTYVQLARIRACVRAQREGEGDGVRTYVYVRAYARTCMAREHHISLFLRARSARIRTYVRTYVCAYVRTCVVFCQTPAIKRQQEFLSMLQRGAAKAPRSIAAKAQSVNGNW